MAISDSVINGNEIEIRSKRAVRIRTGDIALVLEHRGGRLIFTRAQRISESELQAERPDDEEVHNVFHATLSREDIVLFDHETPIQELAFSLTKIRRTDRPNLHFRRKYTYISAFDASVIASGQIYWARTAIGILGSVLPEAARISAVASIIRTDMDAAHDLNRAWSVFREVIEGEYVRPAYLLATAVAKLRVASADHPTEWDIRIVDPDTPGQDLVLKREEETAKEVLDTFEYDFDLNRSRLLDELDATLEASRSLDDERYGEAFKDRRWPFGVLS